jgi:hypothetical protein
MVMFFYSCKNIIIENSFILKIMNSFRFVEKAAAAGYLARATVKGF